MTQSTCDHCGEPFTDDDARAEVARPPRAGGPGQPGVPGTSAIVHAEPCATFLLNHGWEIA